MQLTVILALFIALLAGEAAAEDPQWMDYFSPSGTAALMVGTMLLVWSLSRLAGNKLRQRLIREGVAGKGVLRLPGRVDLLMRVVLLGVYGFQLTVGGYARLVEIQWGLRGWVLVDEVLLIGPLVLLMVGHWYCFYPVNRMIREYVMLGHLAEGLAARPVWSVGQYLMFQLRGSLLIVMVPLLGIVGFKDLVYLVRDRWLTEIWTAKIGSEATLAIGTEAVVAAGAGMIFLLAPLVLKRLWMTRSLPAGPLREKLEDFCVRMKLRYRDILLWETYSQVANAAVMGLIWRIRYLLMSDALIENMSDEQIKAVFGHEAGHVKHHHIMFLVLYVIGGSTMVLGLSKLLGMGLEALLVGRDAWHDFAQWLLYGGMMVLMAGWGILFGWVSRRFEWQADVHAVKVVAALADVGEGACGVADPELDPDENADCSDGRLNRRGAEVMAAALMRIALLNGISPEAKSWRHSSISNRVRLLRHLAETDGALKQFERILLRLKIVILLSLPIGALLVGWLSGLGD